MKQKNNALIFNTLPDKLIQKYQSEFKNLNPQKLDSHIYPLVKSFEKFDDSIIPLFSCSGHNQKPLSLSFIVKNNGEQILNELFQLMLKVDNVKVINSSICAAYKLSVYNSDGKSNNYGKKDNRFVAFLMYTLSLNYQPKTELTVLIEDLKKIVNDFDKEKIM